MRTLGHAVILELQCGVVCCGRQMCDLSGIRAIGVLNRPFF